MTEAIVDVEYALREYLRAQNPAVRVWLDFPRGNPTFPFIVIEGRLGGTVDDYVDVESPRIGFQVWGAKGGAGRDDAFQVTQWLVKTLKELENTTLLADEVHGYGASEFSIVWLPDKSDPSNILPRYLVTSTITTRSE